MSLITLTLKTGCRFFNTRHTLIWSSSFPLYRHMQCRKESQSSEMQDMYCKYVMI